MDKNLRGRSQSWAPLLLPCPCNSLLGRGHSLNYCSKPTQSRSLAFYHPLQQLVWPFCLQSTHQEGKKKRVTRPDLPGAHTFLPWPGGTSCRIPQQHRGCLLQRQSDTRRDQLKLPEPPHNPPQTHGVPLQVPPTPQGAHGFSNASPTTSSLGTEVTRLES